MEVFTSDDSGWRCHIVVAVSGDHGKPRPAPETILLQAGRKFAPCRNSSPHPSVALAAAIIKYRGRTNLIEC